MNKPTLILVNPKAREGRKSSAGEKLEQEICQALGESAAQVVFTTPQDHGSGIVKKALQNGVLKVVVVGGDGTLSETIQGFFDSGRPIQPEAVLMVMPGGRGDDFFKAITEERFFRASSAWKKGLEVLSHGTPVAVDVGHLRWIGEGAIQPPSRYFINIVSFGFPGLTVQRASDKKNWLNRYWIGKSAWAYTIHGASALKDYQPVLMKIQVDGKDFYDGPIHSGFILNGRYNAGGICWDQNTRISDSLFNVLLFEPKGALAMLKNTSKIMFNPESELNGAYRIQGKKVQVTLKAGIVKRHPLFEVDGDLFEKSETRGAEFEVIPGAIRIQMLNKFK